MRKKIFYAFFSICFFLFLLIPNPSYAQTTQQSLTTYSQSFFFRQFSWSTQSPTPTDFLFSPLLSTAVSSPSDIVEVQPVSASQTQISVSDLVTFSAVIKNLSSSTKVLHDLCFESSDNKYGCVYEIFLAPNQIYTIHTVGMWTNPGEKSVWLVWSDDGQKFYTPVNNIKVTLTVKG